MFSMRVWAESNNGQKQRQFNTIFFIKGILNKDIGLLLKRQQDIQIQHSRQAHQYWLHQYDYKSTGTQKVKNTVVFVAHSKNRVVPKNV